MKQNVWMWTLLLTLVGCGDEGGDTTESPTPAPGDPDYVRDPVLNVSLTSSHDGTSSHNAGSNCLQCHQPYGPGPGLFTAAGTIYKPDGTPHANATLELRSVVDPSVVLTLLEVDGNGNFFTTEDVPVPEESVYPVVISANGVDTNQMPFPTLSASCNVCHYGGFPVVVQ